VKQQVPVNFENVVTKAYGSRPLEQHMELGWVTRRPGFDLIISKNI